MKNMLNNINDNLTAVRPAKIFQNEAERREFHDTRMCKAFDDALVALDGCPELIVNPGYAHVRAGLLGSMADWMQNVGLNTKATAAYLRLTTNNESAEICSYFFSAGCMNNRLLHYMELTALKDAHVALKSLQESVIHATLDLMPRRKSIQMVDFEIVERTFSDGDSSNPQQIATSRQDLGLFWRMLYQKPFLQIMAFTAQPLRLTRRELANYLLSHSSTVELFEQIEDVFASILSDKARVRAAMKPIKVMVDHYEPDPEHVQNPDKLVNLLYRYTGTDGALDKFHTAFRKAIAG